MGEASNEKIKSIKFKRKPAKSGKSYFFTIPKLYIDNEYINPDKEYYVHCIKPGGESIKFRKKPAKRKNSYIFTIPRAFVDHELIDTDETYDLNCLEPKMYSNVFCSNCNSIVAQSTIIDPLFHKEAKTKCPYCKKTIILDDSML